MRKRGYAAVSGSCPHPLGGQRKPLSLWKAVGQPKVRQSHERPHRLKGYRRHVRRTSKGWIVHGALFRTRLRADIAAYQGER